MNAAAELAVPGRSSVLSATDIRGMYAIIPTPAKAGADRLMAMDTVNVHETERVINALIRDGASGLIVLGTTGECATLSEPDFRIFVSSVLEAVNRRIPTIVGASALGGHEVVRRLRFISELGAEGSLLGPPMWQPVTTRMAIDFYKEISEIFPDLAIMAYANPRAFRYSFPAEFWEALANQAPTVTSAKYSRIDGLEQLLSVTGRRINFVPNEMVVHRFHDVSAETTTACWATAAGMNPVPVVALMQSIAHDNSEAIAVLASAIAWANAPIVSIAENGDLFAQYNIQLEKTRINAAGYLSSGPVRPPYQDFPEVYAARARECGKRWAQMCAAYRNDFTFAPGPWSEALSTTILPAQ